jgi:hypothetical protein
MFLAPSGVRVFDSGTDCAEADRRLAPIADGAPAPVAGAGQEPVNHLARSASGPEGVAAVTKRPVSLFSARDRAICAPGGGKWSA